ncbi:hypothetical protein ACFYKX_10140 [Cytobacillus sp. FJAT-54145]|uniref:Uncharacterized protein n=1 Tax=Cytobacillus spartinae TaxID=3299023 RepID=A0ABW6K9Y7_9BACI
MNAAVALPLHSTKTTNPQVKTRKRRKATPTVKTLIELGWVSASVDGEVLFLKHVMKEESKGRTVLQILSSPTCGTALYSMKPSELLIREVCVGSLHNRMLKLTCDEVDVVEYSGNLGISVEEIGRAVFLDTLLERGYITPDELKYFSLNEHERETLMNECPHILFEVL